jgi:hypothetical protein
MKFFGQTPAYARVMTTMIFISLGGPKAHVHPGWQSCKSAGSAQPARRAACRDPYCFLGTLVLEIEIQN